MYRVFQILGFCLRKLTRAKWGRTSEGRVSGSDKKRHFVFSAPVAETLDVTAGKNYGE